MVEDENVLRPFNALIVFKPTDSLRLFRLIRSLRILVDTKPFDEYEMVNVVEGKNPLFAPKVLTG